MPSPRERAQSGTPHILSPSDREYLRGVAASWGSPTPEQRMRLRPLLQGTLPADLDKLARDLGHARWHRWDVRGEERTRETFGQAHRDDYPGAAA